MERRDFIGCIALLPFCKNIKVDVKKSTVKSKSLGTAWNMYHDYGNWNPENCRCIADECRVGLIDWRATCPIKDPLDEFTELVSQVTEDLNKIFLKEEIDFPILTGSGK